MNESRVLIYELIGHTLYKYQNIVRKLLSEGSAGTNKMAKFPKFTKTLCVRKAFIFANPLETKESRVVICELIGYTLHSYQNIAQK